ncbi:MAG: phospho-N-acetylmuramoyl-pentapeptide-transferase [Clostridiales bacterium]|nr:phospho-N-acetylmuramoyl-pentapeptide-transferase [Clostridiales bacterium]
MKKVIIELLISLILSFFMGKLFIPMLKKVKASQTILKYVENHESKNGTPTMGGLFFILSAIIVFFIFNGFAYRLSNATIIICVGYMIVGFLDDFLKIKMKQNLGLKAYQKIIFQISIALLSGVFIYFNGLTIFYIPFVKKYVDLGWLSIFLVIFIFLAITNSVNLTDGLDGLAGNVSIVYLILISLLIFAETNLFFSNYYDVNQFLSMIHLSACLIGAIFGFLVFNTNKACIFMGDTGSLALGGFLGAISIFSLNSLFIPFIGIMFVISSISVIIQVLYYKKTKKRVFLMAPLHHHFQQKGYTEGKIVFCYSIITLIVGIISIVGYF